MKKLLFCISFLLVISLSIKSQTIVQGVVLDDRTLEPLVGATIFNMNDSIGVISDFKGIFSLSIFANE